MDLCRQAFDLKQRLNALQSIKQLKQCANNLVSIIFDDVNLTFDEGVKNIVSIFMNAPNQKKGIKIIKKFKQFHLLKNVKKHNNNNNNFGLLPKVLTEKIFTFLNMKDRITQQFVNINFLIIARSPTSFDNKFSLSLFTSRNYSIDNQLKIVADKSHSWKNIKH